MYFFKITGIYHKVIYLFKQNALTGPCINYVIIIHLKDFIITKKILNQSG